MKLSNHSGRYRATLLLVLFLFIFPKNTYAMHISEGFLSPAWSALWYICAFPFVAYGLVFIRRDIANEPRKKLYMGIVGGFVFVLSALKLPSVTGSCSHLTGTGLGVILLGPWAMPVVGFIALLFQALLLAHGGVTTLGANVFSMAVAGPMLAYGVFFFCKKLRVNSSLSVFLVAFVADLFTYIVTSLQLALAYPDGAGGVASSFVKFASMFAVAQLPLAVVEGVITVYAYKLITRGEMATSFNLM